MKIEENSQNVRVDLSQEPVAFPEPSTPDSYTWTKGGQPLTSPGMLTYSSVTFDTITRADSGRYSVTATNYVSGLATGQIIGSDTGSFRLNVICKQNYLLIHSLVL